MNFRNKLFTYRVWWEDNIGYDSKRVVGRSGRVAERHGDHYFVDVDSTERKVSMRVHVARPFLTMYVLQWPVAKARLKTEIARAGLKLQSLMNRVKRRLYLLTAPNIRLRGTARLTWFPGKVTTTDKLLSFVTQVVPHKTLVVPADGMRDVTNRYGSPLNPCPEMQALNGRMKQLGATLLEMNLEMSKKRK